MNFIIDEELRSLIPPLSKEEFEQLKDNIIRWGCLDPLKVWPVPDTDSVILLDGHNRFAICSEHNVSYDTESIMLIDREAAIDWMIANQLGRRNLSAEQIGYLRGKQYQQDKQEITNPGGSNQYREVAGQNDPQPPNSTAAKLAKEHRVSERTIKRDADYAKAIDDIVAATTPEVKQQILGGDSKLTKSAILKMAKLARETPAAVSDVLEEINKAANKTAASAVVQRATKKIKEIPMSRENARLDDFKSIDEAIDWLQQKFKLADLARFIAEKMAEEDSENVDKSDKFNNDESES
jgi:hypothetical protein